MPKEILFISLLLISISFVHPAFSQEFDVGETLGDGMQYAGEVGKGALEGSDLPDDTKQRVEKAIEGGIPVAKKGIDFWTSLHHYVVELIFDNSPIPLSHGIAWLVSLVLIGLAVFHFLRKTLKMLVFVALGIIAVFMVLVVLGIEINI